MTGFKGAASVVVSAPVAAAEDCVVGPDPVAAALALYGIGCAAGLEDDAAAADAVAVAAP